MRVVQILTIVLMLYGCAASPIVTEKVGNSLKGACKELFLKGGIGSYQHTATVHINGKAVFALAEDSSGAQKCSYARSGFDLGTTAILETPGSASGWEQLESIAIARCEAVASPVKAPCKIYARNNNIVWGNKNEIDFK